MRSCLKAWQKPFRMSSSDWSSLKVRVRYHSLVAICTVISVLKANARLPTLSPRAIDHLWHSTGCHLREIIRIPSVAQCPEMSAKISRYHPPPLTNTHATHPFWRVNQRTICACMCAHVFVGYCAHFLLMVAYNRIFVLTERTHGVSNHGSTC